MLAEPPNDRHRGHHAASGSRRDSNLHCDRRRLGVLRSRRIPRVGRRQPAALHAGGARAGRRTDCTLSGLAARSGIDGLHLSARGGPGGALRQGESEPRGRSARQGARGTELGRERQVARRISAGPGDDGREARLDAEARRRLPGATERSDGRRAATARQGEGRGEPGEHKGAEGQRRAGATSRSDRPAGA